jgi:hypothetical protein
MFSFVSHLFPLASETCNDFHPMFFTHDRSFEEFFCICIQLLNKTWKEMRATSEDFNKVEWVTSKVRNSCVLRAVFSLGSSVLLSLSGLKVARGKCCFTWK